MQTPHLDSLALALDIGREGDPDAASTSDHVGAAKATLPARNVMNSPRQRFLALLDYLIEDRDGAVASHVGRFVRWALALALGYLRRRVAGAS